MEALMPHTDIAVCNTKPNDKVQYLFDNDGLYVQPNPNGVRVGCDSNIALREDLCCHPLGFIPSHKFK